jgi:hypothetical protein
MMTPLASGISDRTDSLFVSGDLGARIQLGLEEVAQIREQMTPLIARVSEPNLPILETAAACAMLHSFYTEIEKILKMVAIDVDGHLPPSDSWHRDLLNQMAMATASRQPVITMDLRSTLGEFLAFRHLFRGASIALMRWEKLAPLVAKVPAVHEQTVREIEMLLRSLSVD